jgi:phosphatidylinositol-4,5-bisphosphate 3-kinase catalytic subunit alpha/beta/delta
MLSSNMPELQSIDDIMYVRRTLAIDDSEEDALMFFKAQFEESHSYSFTTKFDWTFHAIHSKE